MTHITLNDLFEYYISLIYKSDDNRKHFYLKDSDCNYHTISEVSIVEDRIICIDGYFDYFDTIIKFEKEERYILYIED